MKKILEIALCTGLLCGCTGNTKTISEFVSNNLVLEKSDMPDNVECFLGSGVIIEISDSSFIKELYDMIQNIELSSDSPKSDLDIADGDILFIFEWKDGRHFDYSFLTSEYFFYEKQYYSTKNPEEVNELCQFARDFDSDRNTSLKSIDCREGTIDIDFIDNGCEALSITVLSADWNDQEIYLEGVYEIIQAEVTDDLIILNCKVGDYYNHENTKEYTLKVKSGTLTLQD